MVSTLKVNKIQIPNSDSDVISLDASTGNITLNKTLGGTSVTIQGEGTATTNLQQGLAKAWINMDGAGTFNESGDTFNMSATTDHGTGDYTARITNDMSNALYSYTFGDYVSNNNSPQLSASAGNEPAAGSIRVQCVKTGNNVVDANQACITIHGDLA